MKRIDFKLVYPFSDLSGRQWSHYSKHRRDIGMVNRQHQVFLEVHTGVFSHELLKASKEKLLVADLVAEEMNGINIHSMNNSNTFLYLTYHGGYHQYARLFWLRDIAEALKKWNLDHALIFKNARTLGIDRLLGISLLLAKAYFNSEIPREYEHYLKENAGRLNRLRKICNKRILGSEKETFFGKLRRHYFLMLLKPGLKYKWAVLTGIYHRWYIRKFMGGH